MCMCTTFPKPSRGCGLTMVDRYGTESVDTADWGHENYDIDFYS